MRRDVAIRQRRLIIRHRRRHCRRRPRHRRRGGFSAVESGRVFLEPLPVEFDADAELLEDGRPVHDEVVVVVDVAVIIGREKFFCCKSIHQRCSSWPGNDTRGVRRVDIINTREDGG